ncbi:hypothetical protein [Labrenzia sp. DG1229]|uniref:hypothetical protein n=1 Tax=Labrenzia sp. DG1229 TaxID=681847 RepID=UPI00048C792C|nr:hypothetical protein [Labrenzia sp. DG1229]
MKTVPPSKKGTKLQGLRNLFSRRPESEIADEAKRELCVHDKKKPVVIVSIFAVEQEMIGEIVDVTSKRYSKTSRLVFVTDCADFSAFMQRGVVFEYLPSSIVQKLHCNTMPWRTYLQHRWDLLLSKWQPRKILAYGQNIERFIENAPDIEFSR